MNLEQDHFKKKMRKALGSQALGSAKATDQVKPKLDAMSPKLEAASVAIDLPTRKQRKRGFLSCRCTLETEDTILALMQKTGLSQSEIINHLIEISLPILADKYLT